MATCVACYWKCFGVFTSALWITSLLSCRPQERARELRKQRQLVLYVGCELKAHSGVNNSIATLTPGDVPSCCVFTRLDVLQLIGKCWGVNWSIIRKVAFSPHEGNMLINWKIVCWMLFSSVLRDVESLNKETWLLFNYQGVYNANIYPTSRIKIASSAERMTVVGWSNQPRFFMFFILNWGHSLMTPIVSNFRFVSKHPWNIPTSHEILLHLTPLRVFPT